MRNVRHVLATGSLLAAGCGGYHSEYAPPADGRPRLVWRDDGPVMVMANEEGTDLDNWGPPGCMQAVDEALTSSSNGSSRLSGSPSVHIVPSTSGGFWVPAPAAPASRVSGTPHLGGARVGATPHLGGARVGATPHLGGARVGASPRVSGSGARSSGGGRSGGGGSGGASSGGGSGGGSSGGGSGEGVAYAAIIAAAVAIVALPFVTLSLALSRPEPESATATAIDSFNAHTDLARMAGSPCDDTVVEGDVE